MALSQNKLSGVKLIMPRVVKKLPIARARVRTSRLLEMRVGARVCAEHELFGDGVLGTTVSDMTNQRCYVCRKPVPTSPEEVKDGRWRDIKIGGITVAALCADCSPKPCRRSPGPSEHPTVAESA
jgi:hypothetical protein